MVDVPILVHMTAACVDISVFFIVSDLDQTACHRKKAASSQSTKRLGALVRGPNGSGVCGTLQTCRALVHDFAGSAGSGIQEDHVRRHDEILQHHRERKLHRRGLGHGVGR